MGEESPSSFVNLDHFPRAWKLFRTNNRKYHSIALGSSHFRTSGVRHLDYASSETSGICESMEPSA